MLSGQRRRRCCLRACCEHEGGEGKHRGTRAVEYGADSRSAHDQFARLLFRQPLPGLGVNEVDEGAERPTTGPGTVRLDRRLNGGQLSAEGPGGDLLDLDQIASELQDLVLCALHNYVKRLGGAVSARVRQNFKPALGVVFGGTG
jgi:hypothetical protein